MIAIKATSFHPFPFGSVKHGCFLRSLDKLVKIKRTGLCIIYLSI